MGGRPTPSLKPAYDGGASMDLLAERTGLIDPIYTALAAWWATAGRVGRSGSPGSQAGFRGFSRRGAWLRFRFSASAAKVLDTLPEHAEEVVWDVLDAAAADPWGFRQWNADDPEGEDVRLASVGQLSLFYWINRPRHRLAVLNIAWFG
ncbi:MULTISPECIES: hypothetical protein [unclassified Streptomyces]|uniref:hypothetical protein n=1 Tax=unclassified Streptomyces TaxID=2593676 RepID=UPI00225918AE|nr:MULTISPECIES: hypothetical protein [unclassified Streptomyces]MCX5443811.1 hypothetical protein [Streptomyces sp. NBC_00063]WUB90852.1 hypothetical protein OHO83_00040 [Streptomyces sp. NBC_00569]WUB99187.1 hypothetical protein OHO83_46850 [Streptomyces sp. NBC_00569]